MDDATRARLAAWLAQSCGEEDAHCEGALRATSIGVLCGWHAATIRPRTSDRERELCQVIDALRAAQAQAAPVLAAAEALWQAEGGAFQILAVFNAVEAWRAAREE